MLSNQSFGEGSQRLFGVELNLRQRLWTGRREFILKADIGRRTPRTWGLGEGEGGRVEI